MLFAPVDLRRLHDALASKGTVICLNEDEKVFCAEGKLPVGAWELHDALNEADYESIICYQYGLNSPCPEYWPFVESLASENPE